MATPSPLPVDSAAQLTHRAWRFLEKELSALGTPLLRRVQPLRDFRALAEKKPLSRRQRALLLDQARLLFENVYSHMPFKREIYELARPLETIEQVREKLDHLGETEFHASMIAAFSLVRDAHTLYGLPSPYRGAVAFLPFQMRCVIVDGRRHYLVSRVIKGEDGGFGHPAFGPGVEILEWNDQEIDEHVQRVAEKLPGGNTSARFTRGSLHSTVRPLTYCQFPSSEAVEILYRPAGASQPMRIRLPWGVACFPKGAAFPNSSFSLSMVHSHLHGGSRSLHHLDHRRRERHWREHRDSPAADFHQVSHIPDAFEFQYTGGQRKDPIDLAHLADPARPGARFGYVHIRQFSDGVGDSGSTDALVEEFRRILTLLDREAPDGLVLDIRSNPGGDIRAAERMLQMLTPGPITPENFHLPNTPAILEVLRRLRSAKAASDAGTLSEAEDVLVNDAIIELAAWLVDADRRPFPESPDRLTSGFPLTDPAKANEIGQLYQGPVALLIDGVTYSAADIFAAGFQDHHIGPVIGAVESTGGGGANVWSHDDLRRKLGPKPGMKVKKLPRDVTMTVALRRCMRVNHNQELPVEDRGVHIDLRYQPESVEDVLEGMHGMVRFACKRLGGVAASRIDVSAFTPQDDGSVTVTVQVANVEALRFLLDGVVALEDSIAPGETKTFTVPPVDGAPVASKLRIEGRLASAAPDESEPRLRAVRTIALPDPSANPDDHGDSVRDADTGSVRDHAHGGRR
jgi:hypothetical protein